MDFNDTTNKNGLCQDCDFWVNSDTTSYPLADKARSANMAVYEVVSMILEADGRWQWDDTNKTDLPIGTTNLVSGQADYGIDTSMIGIIRVEMKDSTGAWKVLSPVDTQDSMPNTGDFTYDSTPNGTMALSTLMTTTGTPTHYDKFANSLFLMPAPNYNSTAGLKVWFRRLPTAFTDSSTTTQPGFAKHLHRYVSLSMAKDYAIAKLLKGDKITALYNELAMKKQEIKSFYSRRSRDENKGLKPRVESNK